MRKKTNTILTPEQVQNALASEGKVVPRREPPSDIPKTAEELAAIKTLSGKKLSLESHPITPAAVTEVQQMLADDGWQPDRDGVRRNNRLWGMFQARARNMGKQLDIAAVKEVFGSYKALKAQATALHNRQPDESAPVDGNGETDCKGCGRGFQPMTEHLVIDGKVCTFRDGDTELPKLKGNFVKAKFANDKFVPTPLCISCLRQYKEDNRGSELDTNGYPFARAEQLCERLNRGEAKATERAANLKELAAGAPKRLKPRGEWSGFQHIR